MNTVRAYIGLDRWPRWSWLDRISPSLFAGILITAVCVLLAFWPGLVAAHDPVAVDFAAIQQGPSLAHPFGTDNLGRDVLSRTVHAFAVDLQIGFFSTIFALIVGTICGAAVGYYGGWAEVVFGRCVDAVMTFPFLVLVIAIVAVLGPGLINMYVAITAVNWIYYARLISAETKGQMALDYVAAARCMGYSDGRIIFGHILPNVVTPALVYWMTDVALAVLLGSSLGYLGLGAQPPTAEWGVLIADGKNYIFTAWWMSLCPGVAVVVTGMGFSLLGDGLADALRPRK